MVTRCARWAETTYEEACSTGLGATPEASCRGDRPDTVLRIRSALPHPKAKLLGGTQPIADSGHCSEARWLLTGRAARECRHFRTVCVAHCLPTRPSPRTARDASAPKDTFVDATPSEELTPSDHLAAVSRHLSRHATGNPNTQPSSRPADGYCQRCRRQRPSRSATEKRPETHNHAPTRRPPPAATRAANFGQRTHPAHRQQLPIGLRWCSERRARRIRCTVETPAWYP